MVAEMKWSLFAIVAAFAAVLVLPGTMVLASNIGWKINVPLQNGFVSPGPKGDNWRGIAPVSPYTTYTALCNAFVAAGAAKANVNLATLNPSTGIVTSVNCLVANATALDPGRGIRVRITGVVAPASPANIVLVGASGTAAVIPAIVGGFVSPGPKGDNWITPPVTSRLVRASEVCTYLGLGLGAGTISRLDPSTGLTVTHNCGLVANNFSLVAGESIRVRKTTPGGVVPPPWPIF